MCKTDECANNPENSSTIKTGEPIFLEDFQIEQIGHLIIQKTSVLYIVGKIA